jgi:ribosomal protein S18 acetylase RimI-like enzyme
MPRPTGPLGDDVNHVRSGGDVGLARHMSITLQSGTPALLDEVVEAVASWQYEGVPVQAHPGDFGWNWSFGSESLAREVRMWRREDQILAAGMVDRKDGLIRMAIAPSVDADEAFAAQLLADLSDPGRGVLPANRGTVEARFGRAFRDLLQRSGWVADEPWTPLRRDLSAPVEDCGLRIEVLDADHVEDRILQDRVAVGRASFPNSTFTLERWRAMAATSAYRRARCLVAYDEDGNAVAATTVWSAGRGRPGLIEPLGAHRDHRGRGHGRAITVAAAAALRQLGSSSATVCTPSSNVGGVAAYLSAGFEKLTEVTDFRRPT